MSGPPLRPLWMELDLGAIEHNLAVVRRLADRRRLIASIKANGYGHDAVTMAGALAQLGVDTLWTGSIDEASAIHAAGIGARILLFAGYLPADIPELLKMGMTLTVHDWDGAAAVSSAAPRPVPVFLKVDSGLGRLGIPLPDAEELIRRIAGLPNLIIEGIYTHLPFANATGRDWALARSTEFKALLARLDRAGISPAVTQVWASSGLLCGLPDSCNAVCVGHLLYGLSPVGDDLAPGHGLRPVLTAIKTRLVHVAHHAAGRHVAIGGHYALKNARIIGVVPLGLGDGMRKAAAGQTMSLIVNGRRAPVLGVSLEHTTLDLTDIGSAQVGDDVIVVGSSDAMVNGFKDLARWFGCGELEAVMSFSGHLSPVASVSDSRLRHGR